MIPELNQSGVLPPFMPDQGPSDPAGMSPYRSTIDEFVYRYAQSPERITILKGLLKYRKKLRDMGITEGFQWVDGSFVENVEVNRGRPPNDIDVVTFALRPTQDHEAWCSLVYGNREFFDPGSCKKSYCCDAYYVDLNIHPMQIVSNARYWFGLFSHQRESYLWKGMIEIPIQCADDEALRILERETGDA